MLTFWRKRAIHAGVGLMAATFFLQARHATGDRKTKPTGAQSGSECLSRKEAVDLGAVNVGAPAPPGGVLEAEAPAPTVKSSARLLRSLAAAVNSTVMMSHLDILTNSFKTRSYDSDEMQLATQYVLDRFLEYGLEDVHYDVFALDGVLIRNVIGVKRGRVHPDRIYMVCAHLDSTSQEPHELAPGAEDNATGCAGVLEAARLLAPLSTRSTIYFVCSTAEEVGLWGSQHVAQMAARQKWDLQGVLNLDMIGFHRAGTPNLWLEGFPTNHASLAIMSLLKSTAERYSDLDVYRYPLVGWGGDHVSFNENGFPAVLVTDYDWNNYPCYHQVCDTVANVDPAHLRRMTAAVTLTLARLAELRSPLANIRGVVARRKSRERTRIQIEVVGTGYSESVADAQGRFSLRDLLPGTYTVRARAPGYRPASVSVETAAGRINPIAISLSPLVKDSRMSNAQGAS